MGQNTATVEELAKAWTPRLLKLETNSSGSNLDHEQSQHWRACLAAVQRTLPLFQTTGSQNGGASAASVPFVCRYRADLIHPLATQQVHELQSMVAKHEALQSLRTKLVEHFPCNSSSNSNEMRNRILTSTSRAELDDLYAPFKPPAKGSILERITSEHPKLVETIDELWNAKDEPDDKRWSRLGPRQAVVQVLGNKIAAEPQVAWWVMEELRKHCRVKTTEVKKKSNGDGNTKKPNPKESSAKKHVSNDSSKANKYSVTYGEFSGNLLFLKDHQVLAIRRGVKEKALKMAFEIDSGKMESYLLWRFRNETKNKRSNIQKDENTVTASKTRIVPAALLRRRSLLEEGVHDAWNRLLRRRTTTRLWGDKCAEAQDRACVVFEDNLQRALLAPPYPRNPRPLLALDPGFAAGIKSALLASDGTVVDFDTVRFLGPQRASAVTKLEFLLKSVKGTAEQINDEKKEVIVALGNGHGSTDCRQLVEEASANSGISVNIQLVNEAGASVWSVTENARAEFPEHPPSAIAAASIGRRLQNPLFELVKVPPRSLGLGMYQHDLSEKELDEKLERTSVDAVATVGVDVNSGSLEILQKVPGLSERLSKKIIASRPIQRRSDLLTRIDGLGPKTYENCAGFVRVSNGPEALDDTLVHPESYELARWLLKEFSWELSDHGDKNPATNLPPREHWKTEWKDLVAKAAKKHGVTQDRVLAVMKNLVDSISKEDPRWKILENNDALSGKDSSTGGSIGLVESCKPLDAEWSSTKRLAEEIIKNGGPIRGIIGTISNVADFGAFIDLGNQHNGLLHVSKLGPSLRLQGLLIGQRVGVDILMVATDTGRIALGLHGCNLQATGSKPPPKRSTSNGSARSSRTRVRGSSSSSTKLSNHTRSSGVKRSITTTTSRKRKSSSAERRKRQKRR